MTDDAISDDAITDDAILGGRLRLWQPREGHRFGHDAVLLAAATPVRPGERVAELGSGVGAASLALLSRVKDIDVTLVEIDPALAALAARNIARNGFAERARAVTLDIAAPASDFDAAGLPAQSFDQILTNPPFNQPSGRMSPDQLRRLAHVASHATLPDFVRAASRLLRADASLTLIWRADGLARVVETLGDAFGALSIRPIHPAKGKPAIRIIVRGTKGSRAPLSLLPGLILNDENNKPTAEAEAILRHGGAL